MRRLSGLWRGALASGAACVALAACGLLGGKPAAMPKGCAETDFAASAAACAVRERAAAAGTDRDAVAKACLDEIDAHEKQCLDSLGAGGAS